MGNGFVGGAQLSGCNLHFQLYMVLHDSNTIHPTEGSGQMLVGEMELLLYLLAGKRFANLVLKVFRNLAGQIGLRNEIVLLVDI